MARPAGCDGSRDPERSSSVTSSSSPDLQRAKEAGPGGRGAWRAHGGRRSRGSVRRRPERAHDGMGAADPHVEASHVSMSPHRASIRRQSGTRGAVRKKQRMSSEARSASRPSESSGAGMLEA
eukprot:scaffold5915_cov128-Isochrysis_galbana.AAC.2